jgi:3-deoxy-manno-octulosonate cytidylyltransferase (CMP-KDO synthetase)
MDISIIIPARYNSTRFPGKPLANILGVSMIERVWIQCAKVLNSQNIFIATDSEKISSHCKTKGMQVVMTSPSCLTGTDRVFEASQKIKAKVVINVQGDEPLITPQDLKVVIDEVRQSPGKIINAMCPILSDSEFRSKSVPKVAFREDGKLLYMSRAAIPSSKNKKFVKAWKQVCIYGYPVEALKIFAKFGKKTPNETIEDIEILRFLELGMDVKMIEVSQSSIAVDCPEDILKVEKAIHKRYKLL